MWGDLLFPLCLMGLSMCCLPPLRNIRILILCVQFVLLSPLVVLVTYLAVSFSGHLHHMSFLSLDTADAVAFSVFYY